MQIHVAKVADIEVISLVGSLDPDAAVQLKMKMKTILDANPKKIIFDLSQLEYTGSAGLREFFLAAKTLDRAGGKMVCCGVQKEVRRIFDLAGFAMTYPTVPTFAEALDKIA